MRTQRTGWGVVGLFALLSTLMLLGATQLFAQVDTGSVLGSVTDQTGAVVPSARVTLTDEGKGFSVTTTTGTDGSYVFTTVKIGT